MLTKVFDKTSQDYLDYKDLVRFYDDLLKQDVLTEAEEKELFSKRSENDKSVRDEVIKRNLKLVISIANNYKNRGLPLIDLVQEGCIGLIKSYDSFDESLGYKFSTYATLAIKRNINYALEYRGNVVKIPDWVSNKIKNINNVKDKIYLEKGVIPSYEELAKKSGLSVEEVKELQNYDNSFQYVNGKNPEDIDDLDSFCLFKNKSFEDIIADKSIGDEIDELLHSVNLSDRQIEIIEKRFGLKNQKVATRNELANDFNISHQRVSQLENKALDKLRSSEKLEDFEIYIHDKIKTYKMN